MPNPILFKLAVPTLPLLVFGLFAAGLASVPSPCPALPTVTPGCLLPSAGEAVPSVPIAFDAPPLTFNSRWIVLP
jgi:hypothetical protein